ncbi:hypothetical protein BOX15_Mlig029753g1 [Macrostomum lignano]|uniref:RGS domain-containing protein n=3 Tax=Macrostomum lignano TaxID=282301 RepID=A0A267G568_9PLAT|nr:hypothetical protein BOX15_Mlig029753g1 [Macrostomum lignano]
MSDRGNEKQPPQQAKAAAWAPLRKRLAVIRTVRLFSKEPQAAAGAQGVKEEPVGRGRSHQLLHQHQHHHFHDDGGVYCGGDGEYTGGDGEGDCQSNAHSLMRSGKSHSTSCVQAVQTAAQQQQPSASQLQPAMPTTPPRLLVSSSDDSAAAGAEEGGHRQATFHFPSGVCRNDDSNDSDDSTDDCNCEQYDEDAAEHDEAENGDEGADDSGGGACCRAEAAGSLSATSLTVSGSRRGGGGGGGGGRPDIQRCHSDSGTEGVPAHALFLRQRGKSQKSHDDVEVLPGGGVYDGDERSCHSHSQQQKQQQKQQKQQQQQLHHHHHLHHHQHHRIRLGFGSGGSPGASERKEKSKKKSIGDKFSFLSRKSVEATSADKASGIKPSCDQVQRWGASFDSLLNDKYGLALFRAFLKTEYSDENIEFWIACEEYRALSGPKKQTMKAQKIYNEFVAFQAPREVNLDSTTRLATINAMGSPDGHLFEQAQKRIQALMEKDSYQRFLRSEVYQNHLRDAAKSNPGSSSASTSLGGH